MVEIINIIVFFILNSILLYMGIYCWKYTFDDLKNIKYPLFIRIISFASITIVIMITLYMYYQIFDLYEII